MSSASFPSGYVMSTWRPLAQAPGPDASRTRSVGVPVASLICARSALTSVAEFGSSAPCTTRITSAELPPLVKKSRTA